TESKCGERVKETYLEYGHDGPSNICRRAKSTSRSHSSMSRWKRYLGRRQVYCWTVQIVDLRWTALMHSISV
ncbi:hypothetical protein J6590_107889, partial [Homalodisca vitripennis]